MKVLKAIYQFSSYLFWPQAGRQRRKMEQLKRDITTIIGQEISEGQTEPLSPLYVSRMLNVPLEEVEKVMDSM